MTSSVPPACHGTGPSVKPGRRGAPISLDPGRGFPYIPPVQRVPRPRIRYLDGSRFRRALIAGARQVMEHRRELNAINVFPVADGDTGSNMGGTLGSIVDGIRPSRETAFHRMLRAIADHALSGARGCSGTILAQFFHGLAVELSGPGRVSTRIFGLGVQRAIAYPYDAVAEPREGTILTVLRDWGEKVAEWSGRSDDFIEVLHHAYRAARASLARTTEKLAVLASAGVVDAGAQGLVHMLGGITRFIATGRIRGMDEARFDEEPQSAHVEEVAEDPVFRYCTQFVVEGSDMDPRLLRRELAGLGDSLIIAGSAARAKVHVHTDWPATAMRIVDRHGTVVSQKVEDMRAQFRAAHAPHRDIALVVDSSCDLPAEEWERHAIHCIPCQVTMGGKTYLDKLTMTPDLLFTVLRETRRDSAAGYPTTSQPAPADFRGRYEFLLAHYRHVISLSLSSALSGTFDAARTGARMAGSGDEVHLERRVEVFDSLSTSIGLGLLARRAGEAIEAGAGRDEVATLVRDLIPRLRIHLAVRSLEGLVRSGRVSRLKGRIANLLHLKPLIRLSADTGGKPVQGSTVLGVRGGRRKILALMKAELDPAVPTEFAITHANSLSDALWFKSRIMESFTAAREPFVVEATSVLAVHVGEGAVGIAYILPREGP